MNVDVILEAFNRRQVDAILIGGMNFLLRHQGQLTYDVDFWVNDTHENLEKVSQALADLRAEWGRDEASWKPTPAGSEWLKAQTMFCLTSREGAIDIFREVEGLEGQFEACRSRAAVLRSAGGQTYVSLSDTDMLACQMALPESSRRADRIAFLRNLAKDKS